MSNSTLPIPACRMFSRGGHSANQAVQQLQTAARRTTCPSSAVPHFIALSLFALIRVSASAETCATVVTDHSLVQGSLSVARRSSATLLEFELPGEAFIRSSVGGPDDIDGSMAAFDSRGSGAPAPTPAPKSVIDVGLAASIDNGTIATDTASASLPGMLKERLASMVHDVMQSVALGNIQRVESDQLMTVGDVGMATVAWLIFGILVLLICGATAVLTMDKSGNERAPVRAHLDSSKPRMASAVPDPMASSSSRVASQLSISQAGGLSMGRPSDSSYAQELSKSRLPPSRPALAPELLVPEGRSCLLHVPALPNVGEVTIDSLGGQPLFVLHVAAQQEVLTLVSYKGDRKVFGLSRQADNGTRMVIYDQTGRPYGTVYEEAPSHYMIGTATGAAWMNIKLTGDMNMIVEDNVSNILAAIEPDPPSGSLGPHQVPEQGSTRRLLRIGPQVDVGLIILAVLSTEVMVQLSRR